MITLIDALMENKVGARCGPVMSHALAASPLQFYTTTAANSYFDIHNCGVEVKLDVDAAIFDCFTENILNKSSDLKTVFQVVMLSTSAYNTKYAN